MVFRNIRLWLALSLALGLIGGLLWGLSEDAAAIVAGRAGEGISVRAPLATQVSGIITSNTTWDVDDSPYQLTGDVIVNPGVTLTIEPGVVVKGGVGDDTTIELKIQGHLEAIGESAYPITFTSFQDSGVGQWAGLVFDDGTGNLQHTVVRYGGGDVNAEVQSNIAIVNVLTGIVSIQSSDVRVDNLNAGTFEPKLIYGIYITNSHVAISDTHFVGDEAIDNADYALYAEGATALLTATHNTFSNTQGYAVRIPPALINSVTDNTFFGGESVDSRRILIDGAQLVDDATLTSQDGLEGYELAQNLEVPDGMTLTVAPGVMVMGVKDVELLVRGHLNAPGNSENVITFTKQNPDAERWGGLVFEGGTGDLQYTTVRYGGSENSLGLRSNIAITSVLTGRVSIQHSAVMSAEDTTLSAEKDYGIYLANSHVLISDTLFLENGDDPNGDYALYAAGDQISLTATGNTFANTTGYAVRIPPALIASVTQNEFSGEAVKARRILIDGAEILTDTTLTAQTGLLGYELGMTLEVAPDTTLTVEPGVAVMGANELAVRGRLDAIGSVTQPITFTSINDSDTGQWGGLVFVGGTGDLQHTVVRYGGDENSLGVQSNIAITNTLTGEVSIAHSSIILVSDRTIGASPDYGIYLMNSRVVIDNTDLYDNGGDERHDVALYIDGAASVVTMTSSELYDNIGTGIELNAGHLDLLCSEVSGNGDADKGHGDGVRVNGGSLFVLGSGLFDNVGFNLVNDTGEQIDASENWWGDSDPSDQIFGDVVYDPVLPAFVCVTDLELTQTDAPYDPSLAGALLTYTIAVTNIEPSPLRQLVISDTLDAGVRYVSGAVSQGTGCTEATTGTVTCDLGAMDIGQTATATLQVKTDVTGVITNQVLALSGGVYVLAASEPETTTLEPAADIWATIQGTPNPAAEGFPLTYTVAVHNVGPATAQDVTLTYTWPLTVEFASLAPTGDCTRNGNEMTCDWGAMARDTVVSATVVVMPISQGWLQSRAEVSSSTEDWNPGNEVTTYELEVAPSSNLSVTMGLAPDPPHYVLAPVTYTIVVTNDGPDDSLGAVVRDTLPVSATFISASPGCDAPVGGVVTCTLGAMAVRAQETLTVAVMAPSEVLTLTNHVEVIAEGADPWRRNNIAELHTSLTPKADLRVAALDAPETVALYAPLTYTIEISNAGPSPATHVRLTDTLPANVEFNAVLADLCENADGIVMCDLGELAPGEGMSVTIATTATQSGPAENTVDVMAAEHDHVVGNNALLVSTQVAPAVDLQVTLSDDPDPVTAGERLTYTLIIANAGPDEATGVALTATLPAEVVYSSTETVQGTPFLATPGVITYSLGAIPAGGAVTATIYVTVNPEARGTLEATATAIAAEAELDAGDNRAPETTTVNAAADLSVGLIQATATVTAGQQLTYTVAVTNSGPSTAMGVRLTNTLPSALSYVSAEVGLAGGSCQAADGIITCTWDELALHQTAWVTMTLEAKDIDASGGVTSALAATSLEVDPDMGNNVLDIPTMIIVPADGGGTIYLPLVMRSSSP